MYTDAETRFWVQLTFMYRSHERVKVFPRFRSEQTIFTEQIHEHCLSTAYLKLSEDLQNGLTNGPIYVYTQRYFGFTEKLNCLVSVKNEHTERIGWPFSYSSNSSHSLSKYWSAFCCAGSLLIFFSLTRLAYIIEGPFFGKWVTKSRLITNHHEAFVDWNITEKFKNKNFGPQYASEALSMFHDRYKVLRNTHIVYATTGRKFRAN